MQINLSQILGKVQKDLRKAGVDLDIAGNMEACCGAEGGPKVKIFCVAPNLHDSVREMGKELRDQVVMVRVDESTSDALDAWVETGAVKSRSEAAALFIREGLKLRADELERLRDALRDVEQAKQRLRDRARGIFGKGDAAAGGKDQAADPDKIQPD